MASSSIRSTLGRLVLVGAVALALGACHGDGKSKPDEEPQIGPALPEERPPAMGPALLTGRAPMADG